MDDLQIQGPELARTLFEIERINQSVRAYGPSIEGVQALLPPGCRSFTMLDVGIGGGDMSRRVVDAAQAQGVHAEVLGIDLAQTTVHFGRQRCAGYPSIQIEQRDLFEMSTDAPFDVVHAAQVLHHFPQAEAVRALRQMLALSRYGVVVNDLHRHPVPWAFIKGATAALSNNRLIRNDAALSVRRGFVGADLRALASAAGAGQIEVLWRPLFRWRMVLRPRSV